MAVSNRAGPVATLALAALALAAAPRRASAPPQSQQVDFQSIAQDYMVACGVSPNDADFDLDELLYSEHYLTVPLGGFDLRLPADLAANRGHAKTMRDIARDMLAMQVHWIRWSVPDQAVAEAALADAKLVDDWIEGWSSRSLKLAAEAEGETLLEQDGASPELLAAVDNLGVVVLRLEVDGTGFEPARVVLTPTRQRFVELISFAGWVDPKHQDALWRDSIAQTTAAWAGLTQIVALEYAAYPFDPTKPFLGDSMNSYNSTGLRQHAADRAAAALLTAFFYRYASPIVESALNSNLIIATCGLNDLDSGITTFLWARQGAVTQPYERFVPGGNAAGGTLPKKVAKSGPTTTLSSGATKWRKGQGKDHFVKPLRTAQKEGAKIAGRARDIPLASRKDKSAHFGLEAGDHSDKLAITAPFLGIPAENKALPPNQYIDDYEEFFRAYRSCFLFWLQTEGGDSDDESQMHFAELLELLISRRSPEKLDVLAQKIYGVPLSGVDGEVDSLEWRFLDWLARQR